MVAYLTDARLSTVTMREKALFLTPAHDWIHDCIRDWTLDWTQEWDSALNASAMYPFTARGLFLC